MRTDGASVTIVGRAATDPVVSTASSGDRVRMRVLAVERRLDEQSQQWVDGDEFGVNVVCWGRVASGVIGLVRKGDPIVVIGRISTRRVERNETIDYFTDVRADIVAVDVARQNGRFKRIAPIDRPADGDSPENIAGHAWPDDQAADFGDSAADPAARPLVAV